MSFRYSEGSNYYYGPHDYRATMPAGRINHGHSYMNQLYYDSLQQQQQQQQQQQHHHFAPFYRPEQNQISRTRHNSNTDRRPVMKRSLSAGTIGHYDDDGQDYYYDEPQYQQQSPHTSPRYSSNNKNSNQKSNSQKGNSQKSNNQKSSASATQQRRDKVKDQVEDEEIDNIEDISQLNEHLDGEPMNELELLALKNAAINKKNSKPRLDDNNIKDNQNNKKNEKTVESLQHDNGDLSNVMSSLTLVDSRSSVSATTTITATENNTDNSDTNNEPSATNIKKDQSKKKKWPLSFLFKKAPSPSANETSENMNVPETSKSIPPTPVLSPDISFSNAGSSINIPSPFELANNYSVSSATSSINILTSLPATKAGVWAFRYPMPIHVTTSLVWIKFDPENQQKITNHVKHYGQNMNPLIYNSTLQITDSHIGHGQIPIVVVPFRAICYFAILNNNHPHLPAGQQIGHLELSFRFDTQ